MCRWMGSFFHDWIDYNGVAFSTRITRMGGTFSDFWGKKGLDFFKVSKRTRMFER